MSAKALDLYSGDGGASMGLHRAGFDGTGVDHKPHPRYPFRFIQADALEFPLEGYDFIWASPPCQKFTRLRFMPNYRQHPDLIAPTRERLARSGAAWCIENVEDAPLGESGYLIVLCGTMFGLQTADGRAELRRHRLFETSFPILLRPACQHGYRSTLGIYGEHVHPDPAQPARDRLRRTPKVLTVCGHTPVDNAGRKTISVVGQGYEQGYRHGFADGKIRGWQLARTDESNLSNWWLEADRDVEQAREEMWREGL